MENEVLYETRGKVAIVTINRPHKRNALNMSACLALQECWLRIESDPQIQVAIVTAQGDKAFCAGFDITEKRVDGRPLLEDFAPRVGTKLSVTKPLIAAVNGLSLAAGVALVESCDLCIAAESAWFGLPEVRLGIGVQPFVQSLWTLPQKVLLEMLITGEPLSAQRAYEVGFVNKLVANSDLLGAAIKMAEIIADNAPLVVRASKAMIYRGQEAMGMELALVESDRLFVPINASEDATEGFTAWSERRKPIWLGR